MAMGMMVSFENLPNHHQSENARALGDLLGILSIPCVKSDRMLIVYLFIFVLSLFIDGSLSSAAASVSQFAAIDRGQPLY